MVKIFNIIDKDDVVCCNYTPENTDLHGYVEISKTTQEVVKVMYSDYEYGKKMYVAHVRSKISEFIINKQAFPKELTVVWY